MKPNRSWPGVPNRYSFSVASMVTQPKSIATVVVDLPTRMPGSSTPTDSMVITASVVSGSISDMAPTVVVLPTPKPPATTIFTGSGGAARRTVSGDCTKSTNHSQDDVGGMVLGHILVVDLEVARRAQVAHQNFRHTQMQVQPRGDLGHGHRYVAQRDDRPQFRRQPDGRVARRAGIVVVRRHLGFQLDLPVTGGDPAGGQNERPERLLRGNGRRDISRKVTERMPQIGWQPSRTALSTVRRGHG